MGGNITNGKNVSNSFRTMPNWNRGTRKIVKEGLDIGAARATLGVKRQSGGCSYDVG